VIINLIKLMITSGIDQINEHSIAELSDLLVLGSSEEEAAAFFRGKI
jgi:hypothetical protein